MSGVSVQGLSFEGNEEAVLTVSEIRTLLATSQGIPYIIHTTTARSGVDRAIAQGPWTRLTEMEAPGTEPHFNLPPPGSQAGDAA